MSELEKVIRGLEAHANPKTCETCTGEDCPYYNRGGTCSSFLAADALALLKAQVPRVMTLDEIYVCEEGDCLYCQCKGEFDGDVLYIWSEVGLYVALRAAIHRFTCSPSLYGSLWRCWTSRPSPEQMANTPWDVSPEVRKKWELDDEIADGIGQTFSPD